MVSTATEDSQEGAGTESTPPRLSARAWARWGWRHLTSMRTALLLLFLLALGAIPGSVFPQRTVSAEQVQQYYLDHPDIAPVLDTLYLFDVYASPWYAAIYLLLSVSLSGCVLPRAAAHYRAMRARPPKVPHDLSRLPYSASFVTAAPPESVVTAARRTLRGYRVDADDASVAAEKGYLRESGNVLFHLALLALLVALAAGSFLGYRGNMLLIEGQGFANTVPAYDSYEPGTAVGPEDLQPFSLHLEEFAASFVEEGAVRGQADSYTARLRYRESPESPERSHTLEVNHPLSVGDAQVYLLGHGYAPEFTVTDAEGNVAFDQAVPFLDREEGNFTSDGVVKVPDTAGEDQLGFTGVFLPTAASGDNGELVSKFPAPRNPAVVLEGYEGDLGLDSGESQSVYQLSTSRMTAIGESPTLEPGDSWELPDGAGTVTFTGVRDYISMQVTSDPGRLPALIAAIGAVIGLLATLFVQPRRYWVRARPREDGTTLVEVGALSKTSGAGATAEFHDLATRLRDTVRETPGSGSHTEKE